VSKNVSKQADTAR